MTKDALAGRRIGFIGAGNMAEAIIRGLLESEAVKPDHITASDVMPERLKYMQSTYGINNGFPSLDQPIKKS